MEDAIKNYEDVDSWKTIMFLYNAGLKEVGTKLEILNDEFPEVSFHDFRVVHGKTHTNLIFDIVKPFKVKKSSKEICSTIDARMKSLHSNHNCVIRVDHDYTAES